MRTILLILLASVAALSLCALLAHPLPSRPAGPADPRRLLAAAALRPERGLGFPQLSPVSQPQSQPLSHPLPRPAPGPLPPPPAAGILPPLTERALPPGRRTEPLEAGLIEAMDRIEPVMDPTRLEGPFVPPPFRIQPGTASLADIFGEHWHLASDDPNVQRRVHPYALAWHRAGPLGCDDYVKDRAHVADAPTLTTLSAGDCERVRRRGSHPGDADAPVPVVAAPLSLAVFAAPLPGARMSSSDFWAAQKVRIEAMRGKLQQRWQAARGEGGSIGLRD